MAQYRSIGVCDLMMMLLVLLMMLLVLYMNCEMIVLNEQMNLYLMYLVV